MITYENLQAQSDDTSNSKSQQSPLQRQRIKSLEVSTDKTIMPRSQTSKDKPEISTDKKSRTGSQKRKLENEDGSLSSEPPTEDPSPRSLLGRIVSNSWNFLTRTLTSSGADTRLPSASSGNQGEGSKLFSDGEAGWGLQSAASLRTQG
jgi:hypothetical protein